MKLRFSTLFSDIFLIVYIMGTLILRFFLEPQLQGNFLISVGLGAFALLFAWALIKVRVLNPSIFNLGRENE